MDKPLVCWWAVKSIVKVLVNEFNVNGGADVFVTTNDFWEAVKSIGLAFVNAFNC